MDTRKPLAADRLFTRCDPEELRFATTEELEDLTEPIGQTRALDSIRFGIGMRTEGYNLFVMGPTGIGKHTTVQPLLDQRAAGEPTPDDWCYLHSFRRPDQPMAVRLAAGRGGELRRDMERMVEQLRAGIPAAFETEEYQSRVQEVEEEFNEKQEKALKELADEAETVSLRLLRTPGGFSFAPVRDGAVISPKDFAALPKEEQEAIYENVSRFQEKLQQVLRQVAQWSQEGRDKVTELNKGITQVAVGFLIGELKTRYEDTPAVVEYLDAVEKDVVEHVQEFRSQDQTAGSPAALLGLPTPRSTSAAERYRVNVIIDHSQSTGAPVIHEDHPSYQNLVGRIEHLAHMGALVTDFTLIKPGALHRANGGYLLLDARKVLLQPFAWEALKNALTNDEIRIESLADALSITSTVSLKPEPIPLEVKVVLLGDRMIYYLLSQLDDDFPELFKVAADFDDQIDRNNGAHELYARFIATVVRREKLRHFDRAAVARVIEHSARLVSDAEKLSAHMGDLCNVLRESSYWAEQADHDLVSATDVQHAIDKKVFRHERIRALVQEQIRRGTVLIDTDGERVGQINGLSVLSLGDFAFGQPSRITATARLGEGKVIDIEREVKLGGPTHSKGVLILSSFLADRYARNQPLSLSASLVFEQSYGQVDGDSASVAELCALLSALSSVPIRQSFAVTGSVNQHGQVQAIGGVNEKIEGFFDVCNARKLSGQQGVLIPAANVKHLMLRPDVVEACGAGRFAIYAVESVDEALELLTGMEAGTPDADGRYPDQTLNRRVADRLVELLEIRKSLKENSKAGLKPS